MGRVRNSLQSRASAPSVAQEPTRRLAVRSASVADLGNCIPALHCNRSFTVCSARATDRKRQHSGTRFGNLVRDCSLKGFACQRGGVTIKLHLCP